MAEAACADRAGGRRLSRVKSKAAAYAEQPIASGRRLRFVQDLDSYTIHCYDCADDIGSAIDSDIIKRGLMDHARTAHEWIGDATFETSLRPDKLRLYIDMIAPRT